MFMDVCVCVGGVSVGWCVRVGSRSHGEASSLRSTLPELFICIIVSSCPLTD